MEKTITYDATHNKASGVGSFTATSGVSSGVTTTGLYTTIGTEKLGMVTYNAADSYITYASVPSGSTSIYPYNRSNQAISFTTSGYFSKVSITLSSTRTYYASYHPYINYDGTNNYFFTSYTADTTTTYSLDVSGTTATSLTLGLIWGNNDGAFTFKLVSASVSFYAKASC